MTMSKNSSLYATSLLRMTAFPSIVEVEEQITRFHALSSFSFGHPFTDIAIPNVMLSQSLFEMIEYNELVLSGTNFVNPPPDHSNINPHDAALRNRSTTEFDDNAVVSIGDIFSIFSNAFQRSTERRPYASAGALYSVLSFAAVRAERTTPALDSGIYNYLPISNRFELINIADSSTIKNVVCGGHSINPPLSIIYLMFLRRAAVKYRYRSYRLALMEAGAMFQQVDLTAAKLGFRTRVWAGFNEHHVAKLCGVDPSLILPLVIQHIGK